MTFRGATGLFTLGVRPDDYRLPHPRYPLPVILVIHRVLLQAFALLREHGFALGSSKEDEITVALRSIIENDLRQNGRVAGFNRSTFETVMRQHRVESVDLTKVQKEPDLCFRLRDEGEPAPVLSTQNALFVECKPVDAAHPAGSQYCDRGLIRFVNGDYAWAMQDALMVGYARQGRRIETHLIPALQDPQRRAALKVVELPRSIESRRTDPKAEALHRSRHSRGFEWPDGKGPAVDIYVYHCWYECD